MLPPQLRQGVSRSPAPSSVLALRAVTVPGSRPTLSHLSLRCFWWGRSVDWMSPNDPAYQRFHRIRTLKTRAKLLEKLRRQGKFEWDLHTKPFFTSKQLRSASHWPGGFGRRGWGGHNGRENNEARRDGVEEDEYELTDREKMWQEYMDKLRKRVEEDPYEAVFGKRFEPFWKPLVPWWIKADKTVEDGTKDIAESAKATQDKSTTSSTAAKSEGKAAPVTIPERQSSTEQWATPTETNKQDSSKLASYSYASTTSWDSWSNKTRRVEWDSVSNKTKQYEYDPISNRMIEVEPSVAKQSTSSGSIADTGASKSSTSDAPEPHPKSQASVFSSKNDFELRKAIPIPPSDPQDLHTMSLEKAAPRYLGQTKSTAISQAASRPAALAKLPEQDLDLLTADDVRASMGKTRLASDSLKPLTPEEKAELERDFNERSLAKDVETDAILKEREATKENSLPKTEWDQAETGYLLDQELASLRKKKEKLLRDERGLFHIERQKREVEKLNDRIRDITTQVENLAMARARNMATSKETLKGSGAALPVTGKPLQSSLDRLQSKDLPQVIDPDDSAAHECTEPIVPPSVPKQWSEQADMLQTDRVRRTAGKRRPLAPWTEEMEDPRKGTSALEKGREKAADMLQAEVAQQKLRMEAYEARHAHKMTSDVSSVSMDHIERLKHLQHELAEMQRAAEDTNTVVEKQRNAYKDKIRSLRGELEIAYKQSTVHSEKHVERIQRLEQDLAKAQNAARDSQSVIEHNTNAYKAKLRSLRGELDIAYKQSTVHAEEHLERIRTLESELAKFKSAAENSTIEKTTAQDTPAVSRPTATDAAKAAQKVRDRELVREVREIYERRYGTIDTKHRQEAPSPPKIETMSKQKKPKQVVEVESDVDLGEALAKYEQEKQQGYRFSANDLENEIAAEEREAHEAQGMLHPENSAKMRHVIARELAPKSSSAAATEASTENAHPGIEWQDPPLYKVLAYDSANDLFSTAVTTSNGTLNERPLSIQQALSQLYQPARFVPHFAELQREGYQVIDGTTDLLVFKKTKSAVPGKVSSVAAANEAKPVLEDHGLVSSTGKATKNNNGQSSGLKPSSVNPVDGTRASPATGNFANATGFVNHDPVFPPELPKVVSEEVPLKPTKGGILDQILQPHRRVRRQEPHFTGTVATNSAKASSEQSRHWNAAHRRRSRQEERRERRRHRAGYRRRRRPWVWAAKVGLGAAGVMYLVGAATEKAREREKDDWSRRAEELRGKMNGRV